jgi:NADH:ubiquinone oxidoreductase subunit 4 (subunit M)
MVALVASLLWLGLYPQPVLNTSRPSVKMIIETPDTSGANANLQTIKTEVLTVVKKGGDHE